MSLSFARQGLNDVMVMRDKAYHASDDDESSETYDYAAIADGVACLAVFADYFDGLTKTGWEQFLSDKVRLTDRHGDLDATRSMNLVGSAFRDIVGLYNDPTNDTNFDAQMFVRKALIALRDYAGGITHFNTLMDQLRKHHDFYRT